MNPFGGVHQPFVARHFDRAGVSAQGLHTRKRRNPNAKVRREATLTPTATNA